MASSPTAPTLYWRSDTLGKPILFMLLFALGALVLDIYGLPEKFSFDAYVWRDNAEFTGIDYLVTHGYRANVDFGYMYGLLYLLIVRLWFLVFPASDLSTLPLSILLDLLAGAALGLVVYRMKPGLPGLAFMIIALPFAIDPMGAVRLEAVFLLCALASQASRRRDVALAFAALAALTKPAMGYVYGFVVLLLMFRELSLRKRLDLRNIARQLRPAVTVTLLALLVLSAVFGVRSVLTTVLPLRGIEVYHARNYGFFQRQGSEYWYFPGVTMSYYLGTGAGFWLAGSIFLVIAGARVLVRMIAGHNDSLNSQSNDELIFTCATVHIMFVGLFYGSASSHTYFDFFLVVGIAAASVWSTRYASAAMMLALLAMVGNWYFIKTAYVGWRNNSSRADTGWLWTSSREREEWNRVQTLVAGGRTAMLAQVCGGELLAPQFDKP
ncbi:MAG TPA: hypothetical protein VIX12_02485, partial [Candidatus Binataceae bacterium]